MQARVENGRVILEPASAFRGLESKEGLLVWMGDAPTDITQAIEDVQEERLRTVSQP